MANNFYGINLGQNEYQAVVNTVTNSTDVEINVNNTNVTSKEDLLLSIEKLRNFIIRNTWPPL